MRRKDKEIVDSQEMEAVLQRGQVCRLGLLDKNRVYIVPLNYGYADNCLFFHSAREGKKVGLLQRNDVVCFEVDAGQGLVQGETGCDWTMHYQSVIGYARVAFLESRADKRRGLEILMAQYAPGKTWEFSEQKLDRTLVLKLSIEEMTGKQSTG